MVSRHQHNRAQVLERRGLFLVNHSLGRRILFEVVHPLVRQRSGVAGTLALLSSAFVAERLHRYRRSVDRRQSQGSPRPGHRRQDAVDRPAAAPDRGDRTGGLKQQSASRPAIYLSDGSTPAGSALIERESATGNGYDLNFENAPVAAVAKVILGDVLNVGYTIDPRVQGTVTLASVRPIAKADALYVLENALRMSGVALVRDRSGYRLVPSARGRPRRPRPYGSRGRTGHQRGAAALRLGADHVQAAGRVRRQGLDAAAGQWPQHPDHHRQRLRPRRRHRHHPELRRRLDEGTIGRHFPGAQLLAGAADYRTRKDHGFRRRRARPEHGQVPVDRPAQLHPRGQPEAGISQARRHLDRAARQVRHRRRQPEGLSAALRQFEADRGPAQRHAARARRGHRHAARQCLEPDLARRRRFDVLIGWRGGRPERTADGGVRRGYASDRHRRRWPPGRAPSVGQPARTVCRAPRRLGHQIHQRRRRSA